MPFRRTSSGWSSSTSPFRGPDDVSRMFAFTLPEPCRLTSSSILGTFLVVMGLRATCTDCFFRRTFHLLMFQFVTAVTLGYHSLGLWGFSWVHLLCFLSSLVLTGFFLLFFAAGTGRGPLLTFDHYCPLFHHHFFFFLFFERFHFFCFNCPIFHFCRRYRAPQFFMVLRAVFRMQFFIATKKGVRDPFDGLPNTDD